jgi:hypothetical protein
MSAAYNDFLNVETYYDNKVLSSMFICILLIPEFKIEIRRQVGDLSLVKEEQ